MKFILDAQLPPRLAIRLRSFGYEFLHTRELPLGNRTPDSTINDLSLRDRLVVVTKDVDFVNSFLFHKSPNMSPHKLPTFSRQQQRLQAPSSCSGPMGPGTMGISAEPGQSAVPFYFLNKSE